MRKDGTPKLSRRIAGLGDLCCNLWWSWHPQARQLFRKLDLEAWHESGHNPVWMLSHLSSESFARAARDKKFLAHYDAVMAELHSETQGGASWFAAEHGRVPAPLAYFCAEFGLHSSLPVYAGGLGILAGDHLKECSDLGVPVVGIGLIYSQGYVSQRLRDDGWQEDVEKELDRSYDPLTQVRARNGKPLLVKIPLFDPPVYAAVWKVGVGSVPLYLLDTNLEINQPWDRAIGNKLYASGQEPRLRQEIVLGMGGMCTLRALGIEPAALHLNEGHPALAILERIEVLVKGGASFQEAAQKVRGSTIFTTHTPVAAGTDIFPFALMEKYFSAHYAKLGIDRDAFLQLGANPRDPDAGFNLTVFALRMAGMSNGVSQKHGEVARRMWSFLWPNRQEEVPIRAITNGVHLPTWIEPLRLQAGLTRYLGPGWLEKQDQPATWEAVAQIPDEELWRTHLRRKAGLLAEIDSRARVRWQRDRAAPGKMIALGSLLSRDVLTVGFARRFTGYKRPDLILFDEQRLKRLLTDSRRPLQIIFAGKAHPADTDGKRLIQRVFRLAQDPECAGRIAFVEDYDQHLARYMVAGVDVWLNNPVPPLEASGTSGMKASINGVPNLSILDGWWLEGYDGQDGWAFGAGEVAGDRTPADAQALYGLLEEKVIPLYYARGDDGIPHGFVRVMKRAIASVAPRFSARRMVKQYVEEMYLPAWGMAGPSTNDKNE